MDTLADFLSSALRNLLTGLLGILVLFSATDTLAWALFELSWPATTEIQGLLLATFALLGAAYGVRCRFHLGVEMAVARLPPSFQRKVARGVALCVLMLGVLLSVYGWKLVEQVGNTLPATGWPAAVGYLPAVLGGVAIAFFGLADLLRPTPEVARMEAAGTDAAIAESGDD